jgi:hypothetical protein
MKGNILKESIKTDSNISSMRIGFFADLLFCGIIAITALILNRDLTGTSLIIGALLAPIAIGKGIQSKYE